MHLCVNLGENSRLPLCIFILKLIRVFSLFSYFNCNLSVYVLIMVISINGGGRRVRKGLIVVEGSYSILTIDILTSQSTAGLGLFLTRALVEELLAVGFDGFLYPMDIRF